MPEARDRVSRAENVAAVYARWRRAINESGNGGNRIGVWIAEPEEVRARTPFRWGSAALTGSRLGSGGLGTERIGRPTHLLRSPGSVIGRENVSPAVGSVRGRRRGRGRGRAGSSLPSWYPRTPLQDVTVITRAIERRRAGLRRGEGHQLDSPISHDQTFNDLNRHSHAESIGKEPKTPFPTVAKHYNAVSVGKVREILLDIANQDLGESQFLTPEKKLLNSIDKVEKVVMEELHKLKRTPTAKKAEREKKVRTLMSMR